MAQPAVIVVEDLEGFADLVADRLAARLGATSPSADDDPWMNVERAAEYLAAKKHRIYDLVSEGKLEPKRDGTRLLFRRSWLDKYIETQAG